MTEGVIHGHPEIPVVGETAAITIGCSEAIT